MSKLNSTSTLPQLKLNLNSTSAQPQLLTEVKMKLRDQLKMEASTQNNHEKLIAYKRMRNGIKNDLHKDREEYYQTRFYNNEVSTASIWATVNDLLGTSSNSYSSAPSMICYQGQVYTKPKSISNALNQIFINKVKNLRNDTANFVHGAASERLLA